MKQVQSNWDDPVGQRFHEEASQIVADATRKAEDIMKNMHSQLEDLEGCEDQLREARELLEVMEK